MWLNENAYADLTPEAREARIVYLMKRFDDAEYGRHLCTAPAEASALKDPRMAQDDFKTDKQAWSKWWVDQGHPPIDAKYLQPSTPPKA